MVGDEILADQRATSEPDDDRVHLVDGVQFAQVVLAREILHVAVQVLGESLWNAPM